jgi:hypothetical protein
MPLEAWMSVCVYSVFVLSCVQVTALRGADPPSKESYRLCKDQETEKATKVQQRAIESQTDQLLYYERRPIYTAFTTYIRLNIYCYMFRLNV